MKKYKLGRREENGLCRIIALTDFSDVQKGDIGGYAGSEKNLSQENDAWVYGNARVSGDAQVYGNAWVYGHAWVYGDAQVYGNARVTSLAINVIMNPFPVTITDNHVQIGCELLRKSHLKQDGMAAAKKHDLDKETISLYSQIIKALLKK